jgi:hypothetical protein
VKALIKIWYVIVMSGVVACCSQSHAEEPAAEWKTDESGLGDIANGIKIWVPDELKSLAEIEKGCREADDAREKWAQKNVPDDPDARKKLQDAIQLHKEIRANGHVLIDLSKSLIDICEPEKSGRAAALAFGIFRTSAFIYEDLLTRDEGQYLQELRKICHTDKSVLDEMKKDVPQALNDVLAIEKICHERDDVAEKWATDHAPADRAAFQEMQEDIQNHKMVLDLHRASFNAAKNAIDLCESDDDPDNVAIAYTAFTIAVANYMTELAEGDNQYRQLLQGLCTSNKPSPGTKYGPHTMKGE